MISKKIIALLSLLFSVVFAGFSQEKVTLSGVVFAANSNENLMPIIVEAVENLATLGEIADTLRTVFGEY